VCSAATVTGEFDLIRRFFADRARRSDSNGVLLGIGDDAALLEVPTHSELVVSVDTVVEGRHFPSGTDPRSIGHRALAVNLSDMAAMGATPKWITLALTLPRADVEWLEAFAGGLFDLADEFDVALVGGDTTRGALTISIQIMGQVPRAAALRRSGAHAGDLILVTGSLGDSGAGLAFCGLSPHQRTPAQQQMVRRFDYPTPRVAMGVAARGIASAAMDISDGLVGDLPKLAQASGLAARVAVESLPLSDALRSSCSLEQAREWALCAGDDYELLLCVPPAQLAQLEGGASQLNLTLSCIGEMRNGDGVTFTIDDEEFSPRGKGHDHFGRGSTQITD
jgi:thiamine-monophosphate kinase